MKLITWPLLAGAVVLAGLAGPASACGTNAGGNTSLAKVGAEAARLLLTHDYKKLDLMVAAARKPSALASDGRPTLTGLYDGLTEIGEGCKASLDTAIWDQRRALLRKWQSASRDPSAAGIALATLDASQAWSARGGGNASSVTEEGRRQFRTGMASSRQRLEQLAASATIDPQWHQAMLDVALGQGWDSEQFDTQFRKATAAFPTNLSYYFSKGSYYAPKWHGSRAQFNAFVDETVRATSSTMGQTMYARLHWSQHRYDMFTSGQADWERMKTGFEDMLKDFPDAWNRNNFARFACLANDRKTASAQIALIGSGYMEEAWRGRRDFEACRELAYRDFPPPIK